MSIVIGETLLALSNVSMNYVNGTEKQVKENAKFSDQLGTTEVNNIVNEIYDKFGINVGVSNSRFECFIPGDVLYRMNTDSALKNKVYAMLADYSSSEFQTTMQTLNPPVKKCTLIFDENGDVERYNVFSARLLIRHASSGKMYLYDVLEIKKETSKSCQE